MSFSKFSKQELILLVEALLEKVGVLEQQVAFLTDKVGELQEENRLLKIKKTSSNSSHPPSTDLSRSNKSLREKSTLKKGGQVGHKGHTLEFSPAPDKTIAHIPSFCTSCGHNLSALAAHIIERRQIIEIPPIAPIYIEHQSFSKTCPCGKICKGTFPKNVVARIQYGDSIESLASYLSVRQYMPYARMQEFFSTILGVKIGQASLVNAISRFAEKCVPFYQRIQTEIQDSAVVGSDETGVKVNGRKGWYFVWQNALNTFISFSFSRGFDTIQNHFVAGFKKSVLISDCWAAQLKTESAAHQLCLAHLIRELNFFIESTGDPWATKCKQLLKEAIIFKKNITDYQTPNPERQQLERRFTQVLEEELSSNSKQTAFQKRLRKNSSKIFTFLYYPDVAAHNNGSERAIRNVKVKQKIAGQFVSPIKAQQFAIMRSVIDTIIKRQINLFNTLKIIAQL